MQNNHVMACIKPKYLGFTCMPESNWHGAGKKKNKKWHSALQTKPKTEQGKLQSCFFVSLHVPWVWFYLVHKETEEGHQKEITMT